VKSMEGCCLAGIGKLYVIGEREVSRTVTESMQWNW
jgi:hypothetical protein